MQFPSPAFVENFASNAMVKGACFWMPGLARVLTGRLWRYRGRALNPKTYGSLRWLHSEPQTCRMVMAVINTEGAEPIVIEALPPQVAQRYEALGLQLLSGPPTIEEVTLCQNALALLNVHNGPFEAVITLVRSVHLLAGTKPDYDTSYSDPELPCSICVSLPTGERHAELRLAESILHEAMHLQLTMLENEMPLIGDADATGFSPWQDTDRPIGGLLHGLFVFRVIDQWLEGFGAGGAWEKRGAAYVSRRRIQIVKEIGMVSGLVDSPALTSFGRKFANWLLGAC